MELTGFPDSTEHLYTALTANDDIDEQQVDAILKQTVGDTVQQLFNNQEQLADAGDEPDEADE